MVMRPGQSRWVAAASASAAHGKAFDASSWDWLDPGSPFGGSERLGRRHQPQRRTPRLLAIPSQTPSIVA